jgi:hypothetical protein
MKRLPRSRDDIAMQSADRKLFRNRAQLKKDSTIAGCGLEWRAFEDFERGVAESTTSGAIQ